MEGIKIFYDGIQVEKYGSMPFIEGFTTNTSIMKQGKIKNYSAFMDENRTKIGNRCISFQMFEDDDDLAIKQSLDIASLGDNVYVKVPIVKSSGETNSNLIKNLLEQNVKVNITTVFTEKQIDEIYEIVKEYSTPVIVSVFAGRISDTATDPIPIMKYATSKYSNLKNIEVLWAGCKETLSIKHAIDCKCHIITIPEPILDRIGRIGKDLREFSIDTARSFRNDAIEGELTII